jgi:hypothetical protein
VSGSALYNHAVDADRHLTASGLYQVFFSPRPRPSSGRLKSSVVKVLGVLGNVRCPFPERAVGAELVARLAFTKWAA